MTGRPDSQELAAVVTQFLDGQALRTPYLRLEALAALDALAARLQAAEQALREIADSGVPGREFRSPLAFVIHLQGIARRALEGAAE